MRVDVRNSSLLGCYGMCKAAITELLDPDINALHSSETSVLTSLH